jgi:hypothetical protein
MKIYIKYQNDDYKEGAYCNHLIRPQIYDHINRRNLIVTYCLYVEVIIVNWQYKILNLNNTLQIKYERFTLFVHVYNELTKSIRININLLYTGTP